LSYDGGHGRCVAGLRREPRGEEKMMRRTGLVLGCLLCLLALSDHARGTTISEAKLLADGEHVSLTLKVVTYAAADFFYIEEDTRVGGIRVERPGHGLVPGVRANVSGTISTNTNLERFISQC
jgi:hypothetical protein